jgi:hypothetical protein
VGRRADRNGHRPGRGDAGPGLQGPRPGRNVPRRARLLHPARPALPARRNPVRGAAGLHLRVRLQHGAGQRDRRCAERFAQRRSPLHHNRVGASGRADPVLVECAVSPRWPRSSCR